jgi:hypothetical protein
MLFQAAKLKDASDVKDYSELWVIFEELMNIT